MREAANEIERARTEMTLSTEARREASSRIKRGRLVVDDSNRDVVDKAVDDLARIAVRRGRRALDLRHVPENLRPRVRRRAQQLLARNR